MRYVLDCSVAVRWFVRQTYWEQALTVLERVHAGGTDLVAPDVIVAELGHCGTFYDALYLALAEREDLQVLTADGRMTRAFAKLGRTLHLAGFSAS